jgi:glycosyltransferase involved in cell wall biosynthesis
MAPQVSVIIPAFNAGAGLAECLASLKRQERAGEFGVLVVDDASTDSTAELVRLAGVTCIRQEVNRGAAAARNLGAKAAVGEVLFFVDADVALLPDTIKNLVDFFAQHPEFSAVVGSYTPISPRLDACSRYHNFFTFYHHDLSGDEVEWFWGAIGAVRREAFFAAGGFDERYAGAAAEDIQLGYALSERGDRIAYFRELSGDHLHRFSLRSMLWNDYRKAVLGTKLYLTRKRPGRGRHGFSNPDNALALAAALGLIGSLGALGLGLLSWLAPLVCLILFIMASHKFYRALARCLGAGFLARAIPLHLLSFLVIAAGTVMGLAGLALGRPVQGKSPWL